MGAFKKGGAIDGGKHRAPETISVHKPPLHRGQRRSCQWGRGFPPCRSHPRPGTLFPCFELLGASVAREEMARVKRQPPRPLTARTARLRSNRAERACSLPVGLYCRSVGLMSRLRRGGGSLRGIQTGRSATVPEAPPAGADPH